MQTQMPVRELRANPILTMTAIPQTAPLFIGDIVTVLFNQTTRGVLNRRGVVVQIYHHDRYKVDVAGDDGDVETFSVPRELLVLVRRADA